MRKLAFLFVAFVLVAVSFYGCDEAASEPESTYAPAVPGRDWAGKWVEFDRYSYLLGYELYLDCLDETVLVQGEMNKRRYANAKTDGKWRFMTEFWWTPEVTTMVGPSGTWIIVSQDGWSRWESSKRHDVFTHSVTWKNEGTGVWIKVRTTRHMIENGGVTKDTGGTKCTIIGKRDN